MGMNRLYTKIGSERFIFLSKFVRINPANRTMLRNVILLIGLISQTLTLHAQGYEITVDLKGAPENQYVRLAHYYGGTQYITVDSAQVKQGRMVFRGSEPLKGGMYMLVFSPSRYYDFLISGKEPAFSIAADTTDFVKTVKFKGSPENESLFNYRRFIVDQTQKAQGLNQQLTRTQDKVQQTQIREQINQLQTEVKKATQGFVGSNFGSFAAKIIQANQDPELPTELPKLPTGRVDSSYLIQFYKNHYFDFIDFSDERMIRTPFLQGRVERYFKDLVYQVADSIITDADKVLGKAKVNLEVYRYVLYLISNKYENIDVVGLDGVFVHLAENHYLKNGSWLDEKQRKRFQDRVSVLKPLVTGKVFPDLLLYDAEVKPIKIGSHSGDYKFLIFYSPDCSHCKESAPKIVKFNQEFGKNRKIAVYMISTDIDAGKWSNFIKTYQTNSLINVWDAKRQVDFLNQFDVYATPTTYILDSANRIIAKRLPVEDFARFIEFYERNKKK